MLHGSQATAAGASQSASPALLSDSPAARNRYRALLAVATPSVYQTLPWLDAFRRLSGELFFAAIGDEVMVPVICKGRGALRRAYSLPFDTYGGPVCAGSVSISFDEIAAVVGAPSIRIADYHGRVSPDGADSGQDVTTHVVELSSGYQATAARYSDMNRRLIRQAVDRGVTIETIEDESELGAFHQLHRRTVARYQSRPFPIGFFQYVYRHMVPAGTATFYRAMHGGQEVGGNLVLRSGERSIDWMWVYDARHPQLRVTNALIDRAIRDESARGARTFNLGASPDDRLGSVLFKKSFGSEPQSYTILSRTGGLYAAARRAKVRLARTRSTVRRGR